MFQFTADLLQEATGGTLLDVPLEAVATYSLSTDSRKVASGQVFVPLSGPRFDGHDFLEQVLELPGTGVMGTRDRLEIFPEAKRRGRLVLAVADPLTALGDAAAYVRTQVDVPVVGLTGSVGKTTTKELIRSILSETGPGLATEGNLNNLIGLPLMLMKVAPQHRWVVLEMGMNAFGEIDRLARIAVPNVRLITNVVHAHTEGVGGIDGVARAKGELFASARAGDTVVVNLDDPRVSRLPVPEGVDRVTFGTDARADVRLASVSSRPDGSSDAEIIVAGNVLTVHVPLAGRHNALNAVAAAAVAHGLGVRAEAIERGIQACRPLPMRMEQRLLRGDILLVNDAYNANPASMGAALDLLVTLKAHRKGARAIAVLGDMLELGDLERTAHHELGRQVREKGVDALFACGPRAAFIAAGALEAGLRGTHVVHSEGHEDLAARLNSWLEPGDIVLFKGSRGARMEKVLAALEDSRAE